MCQKFLLRLTPTGSRLLAFLQMLLLLGVPFFHLLGLLLVPLFHLLLSCFIRVLLSRLLVFLFLLRRQFLVFFFLLRGKFILLFLIFLVQLCISSVRSRRTFVRLQFLGVVGGGWPGNIVSRTSTRLIASRFGPAAIGFGSSFLPRWHSSTALEFSRPGCGCNFRSAVVHRGALLRIISRSFRVLSLGCHGSYMSFVRRPFFFWGWTRRKPTAASVVANAAHVGVVNHRGVVHIVNIGDVHVRN